MKRVFAHWAGKFVIHERKDFLLHVVCHVGPRKRVHGAFGRAGILFEPFLELTDDRAFRAADRTVQQDDAAFGSIVSGRGLERVYKVGQTLVDAVDSVVSIMLFVPEEPVARVSLLVLYKLLNSVREDHVVNPLKRVSCYARIVLN